MSSWATPRADRPTEPWLPPGQGQPTADIIVGTTLALVAAVAAALLPEGSSLRWAAAAPALLLVPGYLALQLVFVPARPARRRVVHAVAALGLSPALVGLVALATALVPGGFRPPVIVASVTLASLVLAGAAYYRRAVYDETPVRPDPVVETDEPWPEVRSTPREADPTEGREEDELGPRSTSG